MATDVDPVLPVLLKVIIRDNWFACTKIIGYLSFAGEDSGYAIPLDDPSGLIYWDFAAQEDENGDFFIAAGSTMLVQRPSDAFDGHYELIKVGHPCQSGSESSGSGSETSESGQCLPIPRQFANLPILMNPTHLLGFDKVNNCYGLVPTEHCGS